MLYPEPDHEDFEALRDEHSTDHDRIGVLEARTSVLEERTK